MADECLSLEDEFRAEYARLEEGTYLDDVVPRRRYLRPAAPRILGAVLGTVLSLPAALVLVADVGIWDVGVAGHRDSGMVLCAGIAGIATGFAFGNLAVRRPVFATFVAWLVSQAIAAMLALPVRQDPPERLVFYAFVAIALLPVSLVVSSFWAFSVQWLWSATRTGLKKADP